MIDVEVFQLGLACFMLGVSVFCANSLLLRRRHWRINLPLALFFVVQSITMLPLLVFKLDATGSLGFFHLALEFLESPLSLMQAPLFWLYVRGLTSEDVHRNIRHKALHLLPVGMAVLVYVVFLTLPEEAARRIEQREVSVHPAAVFVVYSLFGLVIVFLVQVAVYLTMIIRLLRTYSSRLKDLFASTEDRELTWVWWIAAAAAAFLAFSILELVTAVLGLPFLLSDIDTSLYVSALFTVPFMWVLALWGLRQQPGLDRVMIDGAGEILCNATPTPKYERSALTSEHANRIAAKIERAMQKDLLYRDPNLSLWDLAKHIGVTSNYVSQTLNETVGESFFDYVNCRRIKDALQQMKTTDQTILIIAYDVGFNSRSAFYRAFKRETGQTPSKWRAEHEAGFENADTCHH